MRIVQTKNQLQNYTNQLLEHLEKVHLSFKDNIWGTDVADMPLISKLNRGIRFSLCVIGTFSKYGQVIPLKDKKDITITNAFQKKKRKI